MIDLGQPRLITRYRILQLQVGTGFSYQLQSSADAITWTTRDTIHPETANNGAMHDTGQVQFNYPILARYWKLIPITLDNGLGWGVASWELRSGTVGTNHATRLPIGSLGQVLTTISGGVAAWVTPSGSSSGFTNPMTTLGDIIYAESGGAAYRLGIGSTDQVLKVTTGKPQWATISISGLTDPTTTDGDILYRNSTILDRLPIGSTDQVLTVSGGHPHWQNNPAGFSNPMTTEDDIIIAASGGVAQRLGKGSSGQVLTVDPSTLHLVWATPSAGGGTSTPKIVQYAWAGTQATTITLPNTPIAGHSLILFTNATTGQVSAVASTNTTWTQVKTYTSAGNSYYAIWVGIVGSSPGTSITLTKPGTYNSMVVMEITDALTPTLGLSATDSAQTAYRIAATTAGHIIVHGVGSDNTTLYLNNQLMIPHVGVEIALAMTLVVGYSTGEPAVAFGAGVGGGVATGSILAEIT